MSNCVRSLSEPEVSVVHLLKYLCLYRLVIAGKVPAMHAHGCCTMRRHVLANLHAWIVEWEWECTLDREHSSGGRSTLQQYILTRCNGNWSHDSDS